MSFAIYIPVGPSSLDIYRLNDLLSSIRAHEPSVDGIILVDHGATERNFSPVITRFPDLRLEIIKPCFQHDHGTWRGAGCVANLASLKVIIDGMNPDFVLKLDTDALVIGPFGEQLSTILVNNDSLGIVGTLGTSCNMEKRTYAFDTVSKRRFDAAFDVSRRLRNGWQCLDNKDMARWNIFGPRQAAAFRSVCDELQGTLPPDFSGQHCQGGAYGISKEFILRMTNKGYLNDALRWLYIPIDEDKMMGAYCSSVGLALGDLSRSGEPFGVQNVGLAYGPREMLDRGYKIIHSVRNDAAMSENDLRRFFKTARSSGPLLGSNLATRALAE